MTKTLLLLTCATSAMALSAGAAMAATDAATDTSQGASSVAELVVVAEHRTTELQKIPVAVSVYTSQQRDLVGISSVQDFTNFAPGLAYDPVTVHAYIRGVGRQSVNVTDDQRVASYEDEFYVYSAYGLSKSTLFLSQQQIERGPQNVGGRNAAAGSIDSISVRPTDDPYAEIRVSGGNYGRYNIEGAVSGNIAPGVDVRLAAFDNNQTQGFYKNLMPGLPSEGSANHEWYVEGQLDYKPNDKVEFWARGFLEGWNNRGDAGSRVGYMNGSWNETTLTDSNAYTAGGLFVNPNFGYAAPGGNPTANAALVAAKAAGISKDPVPTSVSLYVPGILNNPSVANHNSFISPIPRNVTIKNYDGFNYILTYNLPDMEFKYTGGVQGYDYDLNYMGGDASAGADTNVQSFTLPGSVANAALIGGINLFRAGGVAAQPGPSALVINPFINANYKEDDWWTAHDFSLQSTGDSPLQWIVGAFFYYQHYDQPYVETAPLQPQLSNPYSALPSAVTGAQCPSALGFFCGFTAGTLAAPNPQNVFFSADYNIKVNSDAAYAQVSYKLNDQFKITGNLRYSYDRKWGLETLREVAFNSLVIDGLSPYFGNATPALDVTASQSCLTGVLTSCNSGPLAKGVKSIGVIGSDGYARRQLDDHSSALTGGAGIEWTPTSDIFTYARYSRGYESLSYNAGLVSFAPEVAPEYVDAYEIGYKQNIGRQLSFDVAAFYYDYQNIQIPLTVSVGGVNQTQFINIPKSVSEGVELEGFWTPVKDLVFSLSYAYDYTAIKTGCSGTVTAGALTPNSNALCVFDTADPAAIQPGARPFPGQTTASRAQSVNGNALPDAARNKLAVTGAYTWHFGDSSLTFNTTFAWRDKQNGNIFQRAYNVAPSWDDLDFRATWKGPQDRYEIIGYVKNALDSLQYAVGNGGYGLSGTASSVNPAATGFAESNYYNLAPPRTYGVEVRYKFF
jgi:iron complex outermembrane receptor protein